MRPSYKTSKKLYKVQIGPKKFNSPNVKGRMDCFELHSELLNFFGVKNLASFTPLYDPPWGVVTCSRYSCPDL